MTEWNVAELGFGPRIFPILESVLLTVNMHTIHSIQRGKWKRLQEEAIFAHFWDMKRKVGKAIRGKRNSICKGIEE